MTDIGPVGLGRQTGGCACDITTACSIRVERIAGSHMAAVVLKDVILHGAEHVIIRIAGRIDAGTIQLKLLKIFVLISDKGLRIRPVALWHRQGGKECVRQEIRITPDRDVVEQVLEAELGGAQPALYIECRRMVLNVEIAQPGMDGLIKPVTGSYCPEIVLDEAILACSREHGY